MKTPKTTKIAVNDLRGQQITQDQIQQLMKTGHILVVDRDAALKSDVNGIDTLGNQSPILGFDKDSTIENFGLALSANPDHASVIASMLDHGLRVGYMQTPNFKDIDSGLQMGIFYGFGFEFAPGTPLAAVVEMTRGYNWATQQDVPVNTTVLNQFEARPHFAISGTVKGILNQPSEAAGFQRVLVDTYGNKAYWLDTKAVTYRLGITKVDNDYRADWTKADLTS